MIYMYEVNCYDKTRKKQVLEPGLVFADCYYDAVKELEEFYYGDCISSIYIEIVENNCPIHKNEEKEI